MAEVVKSGKILPPDWWLNQALILATLWQELKDLMTEHEMAYKAEIVDLIEQGKKIGQANLEVEAKSENYKMYCYLKGRDCIVEEMIRLSKKRSQIPNL